MSGKWVDLHLHTIASDGTYTPKEIIEKAKAFGLDAIAITDHDSIDSLEEARKLGDQCGVEVIPGIELTAYVDDFEVHILGYFFDEQNEILQKKLKIFCKAREQRVHDTIVKLNEMGISITAEEVFKFSGKGAAGRLHIARALVQKKAVSNTQEAFRRFLANGKPACVPKENMTTREAIQLLLDAGGVPVLAHPGLMGRDDLIPKLVEEGLKGIEAHHYDHSAGKVSRYAQMAQQYGLIVTGGSDCHGNAKGRISMGDIKIPYQMLEQLRQLHLTIKSN